MWTFPRSLRDITPLHAAAGVFVIALATITGAWIFEWAGYLPCELCLKQRWAYYAGVPAPASPCSPFCFSAARFSASITPASNGVSGLARPIAPARSTGLAPCRIS